MLSVLNLVACVTFLSIQVLCEVRTTIFESSDVYFQSFNFTGLEDRFNLYKKQIYKILSMV